MYVKKRMAFPNAIEVFEYHSAKYGAPGQARQPKKEVTPEMIAKRNQYNKERLCRWRLRTYFDINDYFVLLTFQKDKRPENMEEAVQIFGKKFIKKLREIFRKEGHELRWIRNIEVGTKNAWHIHMVVNRIPDIDLYLRKCWGFGKVVCQLLYEKGEFAELAAYLTKSEKTDSRLKEASYSTSRNMPLPDPEVKKYTRWKTWKDVKVPDGYYLDKNSFHEGINPFTGYKFRLYTLLKMREINTWNTR